MPADTVRVARPSMWGNPSRIGMTVPDDATVGAGMDVGSREVAVQLFRHFLEHSPDYRHAVRTEAAGSNVACWCPLEDAAGNHVSCHADVLLEIANQLWIEVHDTVGRSGSTRRLSSMRSLTGAAPKRQLCVRTRRWPRVRTPERSGASPNERPRDDH